MEKQTKRAEQRASKGKSMKAEEPLHKYDTPEMRDPLVRCYHCAKLVATQFINKHAGCNHCGNKRFNFLYTLTEEEMNQLRQGTYDLGFLDYRIDPEYLDIFEGVKP